MRTILIALAATAAFGLAGFAAAPASAAPIAPAHLAAHKAGNHVQQVHKRRGVRRHVRRDFRRHARRHFWAPSPWAFRHVQPHNCFRISRGYVCYY